MLRLLFIVSCLAFFFSEILAGQESRVFPGHVCDPETLAWTSWFNTQDPSNNQGNDIEDLSLIQRLYDEAARCSIVLDVEHSILNPLSTNTTGSYQTIVNETGVFCLGSPTAHCPNYNVRFCCPMTRQAAPTQCGRTFRQPTLQSSVRIVNGVESVPHSFPWAVSLLYKGVHDCGGVILSQRHILTAAHCLDYPNDLPNYYARVGAHNRLSSGQLIPIAELILHPNYDEQRSTNDIGIIKLAASITFTQEIQPICLVDRIVEPPLNTVAFVAGWGNTVYQMRNSSSPVLRQARLRVIADCSMYPAYDSQKQICAASNGPVDKDHGSCQGDSGGALLYSKADRWYVGGVVSYATGCGRQAFPTVFTKTAAYIDWIRAMIN